MSKRESDRSTEITPADIREMAGGFQRSRVVLTAYELDLFTALGDASLSSDEVASKLGTDPRATDRLMNALCAIGLLQKADGRFANGQAARQCLVKGEPGYMSGLMHIVHIWNAWHTLTGAVKAGTSIRSDAINDRGEAWLSAFIEAMHARARQSADATADALDLKGVSKVLDVGGGSGVFSMAFVRAVEGVHATVFDLPNVVPLTRQYIEREGLSDRIDTVVGDYTVDPLGEGYDLVFLSAIIHSNSFEENRALIAKCAAALNPGGQLAVQDFIMDDDRTSPPFGAMFALNMLVATSSGDTYTESEIGGWMRDAGLGDVERRSTVQNADIIVGKKKR